MIIEKLVSEKERVTIAVATIIEDIIFEEYLEERKKIIESGVKEFKNLHKLDENFELYDSEKIRNKVQELKNEELNKMEKELINYYLFRLKKCNNNMLVFLVKYYPEKLNYKVSKELIEYYLSKGYGNI